MGLEKVLKTGLAFCFFGTASLGFMGCNSKNQGVPFEEIKKTVRVEVFNAYGDQNIKTYKIANEGITSLRFESGGIWSYKSKPLFNSNYADSINVVDGRKKVSGDCIIVPKIDSKNSKLGIEVYLFADKQWLDENREPLLSYGTTKEYKNKQINSNQFKQINENIYEYNFIFELDRDAPGMPYFSIPGSSEIKSMYPTSDIYKEFYNN